MKNPSPFKWRHFEAEIILLCVRWYLRYSLSYRDLEEMMLERGLQVDHTTIYRWVQCYAPEQIGRAHRLNSSHTVISYAVFCLKKKKDMVNDTMLQMLNGEVELGARSIGLRNVVEC